MAYLHFISLSLFLFLRMKNKLLFLSDHIGGMDFRPKTNLEFFLSHHISNMLFCHYHHISNNSRERKTEL